MIFSMSSSLKGTLVPEWVKSFFLVTIMATLLATAFPEFVFCIGLCAEFLIARSRLNLLYFLSHFHFPSFILTVCLCLS